MAKRKQAVTFEEINAVLAQVVQTFRELADEAGDVEEWNEGGHAYEAADAVRGLREKLSGRLPLTRRIQFLTALENSKWDTVIVDVPAAVGTERESLVQWAETNLAGQAQYRKVVLFALHSTEPNGP